LGKLFVRELIKKECWDKMKVKGRGIQVNNQDFKQFFFSLKIKRLHGHLKQKI